jgi:hypothetical protein
VVTGDNFSTEVLPLSHQDLAHLTKKNGWKFNWKKELQQPDRQVFKPVILGNPIVVQGVISISIDVNFVKADLIEVAPFNFGKHKMYFNKKKRMYKQLVATL